jgi:hypothetical protein
MSLIDRLRRFVDRTPRLTPEEVRDLGTLEPVLGRPGFLADFRQGLLEMGCDPCGFRTIPYSWNGRIRTPVSAFSYTRVRGLSQLLA